MTNPNPIEQAMNQILNSNQAATPSNMDVRDVSIPARIFVAMRLIELIGDRMTGVSSGFLTDIANQIGPDAAKMINRAKRAIHAPAAPERTAYLASLEALRHYISGEHSFFDFSNQNVQVDVMSQASEFAQVPVKAKLPNSKRIRVHSTADGSICSVISTQIKKQSGDKSGSGDAGNQATPPNSDSARPSNSPPENPN